MKDKYWIILIILLGLLLRLPGINWGLPNEDHPNGYHPDEPGILYAISNMDPAKLDFNPNWFVYPTFYIYLVALSLGVSALIGVVSLSPELSFYLQTNANLTMLSTHLSRVLIRW